MVTYFVSSKYETDEILVIDKKKWAMIIVFPQKNS